MDLSNIVIRVECGTKKGTAFLISKNRALTVFHVVTEFSRSEINCTDCYGNAVKANLSSKIDEKYKRLDIALLELQSDMQYDELPNFIDYSVIASGTNWSSRGYPLAKQISGDNLLVSEQNIVNQQLKALKNGKVDIELEHSKKLSTYSGYSGSPLIVNGYIAGIINMELLENGESRELTALSLKYFKDILLGEGVEVKEKKNSAYNPIRKLLTNDWFKRHTEKSIFDLGVRYTPEVNVKVDITNKIEATLKNNDFCAFAKNKFHVYLLNINSLIKHLSSQSVFLTALNEHSFKYYFMDSISVNKSGIQRLFEDFINKKSLILDLDVIKEKAEFIHEIIEELIKLYQANDCKDNDVSDIRQVSLNFLSFLEQPDINTQLANEPFLLLKGKAGTGKSHLLADSIASQHSNNIPSILLLGQHFSTDRSPWSQILDDLLRLKCTEHCLLEALNEIGEEKNQRILFAIDAINEGRGRFFWHDHIISFINDFEHYRWISLVITVRDSYFPKLIPEALPAKTKMKVITHAGFAGGEFEAVKVFFNYYNINWPKTPIINPEFTNPLFLKLFCEGLHKRGLSSVPEGYGGLSSVMNYYIDNIDTKLGGPQFFDYGDSGKVCRKIVYSLIEYKQTNEVTYVPYDHACDIANAVTGKYTNKKGIIEDLVHEGLLSKNIYWLHNGEDEEGVYFAYERIDDLFSADLLVRKIITPENIEYIFKANGALFYLTEESYRYQGLIEALSIQLPDKLHKEFFQVVENNKREDFSIISAFINSLIWRNVSTINSVSDDYINSVVLRHDESSEAFLDFIYIVAGDVEHPYNADALHGFLAPLSLAVRDANWTTFLNDISDSDSAISRSLEWIFQSEMHKSLSEESTLLVAIATSWLFTSTNIELRNNATQALTIILTSKLDVGVNLLKNFRAVNDPYVYERILAALYGASLNDLTLLGLNRLASCVLEEVFLNEEVYVNVLVRDYARNIIEFALFKGEFSLDNSKVITPPYNSSIPDIFPSNDETDAYKFDWDEDSFQEIYGSQNRILSSMVTEYGRGISQYGDFGRYVFQSALSLWKLDPNPFSNYACKLIFEKFGYDVNIHGHFDRHATGGDRFKNNVERIGKKYQWLALYEVVARLADNYAIQDREGNELGYYQGPWQNGLRNIDPTYIPLMKKITKLPFPVNKINYDDWYVEDSFWLTSEKNLPDPKDIIVNHDFLSLEADYSWQQKDQLGIELNHNQRKNIWYQIRSYLVKVEEYETLKNWLIKQDFMGRWMPESEDSYSVFCKEHYWSPAYKSKLSEAGSSRWQPIKNDRVNWYNREIIAEVLPTVEVHRWEDENVGISFLAPRAEMFNSVLCSSTEMPGCWLDEHGQLFCFDPHIFGEDKSELLINKKALQKLLENNGMQIIWTVLGEKQILDSSTTTSWLDMSGVYYLVGDSIEGNMTINLKGRGSVASDKKDDHQS